MFSQPVYGDGSYPDIVVQTLGGLLPNLTAADQQLIKGSAGFYAIDGYRTDVSQAAIGGIDACIANPNDPRWPSAYVMLASGRSGP